MPQSRFNRLSLIIAVLALAFLTTPLVNLIIMQGNSSAIIRTGTGLFSFWMLLILLIILANRAHRKLPDVSQTTDNMQKQDTIRGSHLT